MLVDWIKHMSFLWPENFMLFGLIPLLIWWKLSRADRSTGTVRVSSSQAFREKSWKNRMLHFPFVLRLLAISALIMALARPQQRNDQQQTLGEGIDIVLCMDVSGSMNSTDIKPSRMEVAKEMAQQFVQGRPVDRIGLVIFSGESFTQCPITTDRATLIRQIQALESRRFLKDGTVIGEGLATAVDRLSQSKARSKVIILMTDGKEDAPDTRLIDPLTALDIARSQGVKVYTIGMGVEPSTITERPGTETPSRNAAVDFLDVQLLQRIANETGGRYFRARDKEGLQQIYAQIDQLEKSKIDVTSYKKYQELFLPFVLAALGFLLLEMVLRYTIFRKIP
ncbi:MAG: VWA domain-containing protein [Chitinophagaceae bacterium]|nr:VWA domain-containing protein [Chitinophagaceae bacterium]